MVCYGIEGKGELELTFSTGGGRGENIAIRTVCYYVPDYKPCLLSPQRLFNRNKEVSGKFIVEEDHSTLKFKGIAHITSNYDSSHYLTTVMVWIINREKIYPSINMCITSEGNQNLTPVKKKSLHWYSRFGYHNLMDIQLLLRNLPFVLEQFLPCSKIFWRQAPL